jgi:hypothetical protein
MGVLLYVKKASYKSVNNKYLLFPYTVNHGKEKYYVRKF